MKISIIGGGAAGMMAAAAIIEKNPKAQVTIYEKNSRLGRKLVMTGGGRCNITTAITDVRELMKKYPRGDRWLKYAMYEFGPAQTYEWFENHGVKLKTEGLRVFPASENGEEIVAMFMRIFKNAKIEYETEVKSLNELNADRIIITTGGKDGGGYKLAESAGHTITPIAPTLTSFVADVPDLSGVTIEKAKLSMLGYEFIGPFLFTHTGITGPAVFALSAFTAYENLDKGADLTIDFVPDLNHEQLKSKLENPSENFVPKSVLKAIGGQTVDNLKNFKISVTGRTPGREIVTAGGVSLDEVDPKTMQSLKDSRLYFAGEIIDADGLTGGFNLQIAWATGKLAGESAAAI